MPERPSEPRAETPHARSNPTPWHRILSFARTAPVTVGFIALCLIVYLINLLQTRSFTETIGSYSYTTDQYGNFVAMLDRSLGWDLIFSADFVHQFGQWWRIFTASLVHLDIVHLLLNAVLILLLGREVERVYGKTVMACTIIAGAAGGAIACMYFEPESAAGGASTVGYALCALLIAIVAQRGQSLRGPIVLIAVNIGISFTLPGISLWGHIGGLCAGMILALLVYTPRRRSYPTTSRPRIAAAVAATAIISIAAVVIGLGGHY